MNEKKDERLSSAFAVRAAAWDTDNAKLRHVRRTVFIDEQRVPEELEWDDDDPVSEHALAEDSAGNAIATGRLLADGHLGRIAVVAPWRGRGVGAAVFEHLMRIAGLRGHRTLRLNAQKSAIGFYENYGFVVCGEEFVEAGLTHRKMRRD
jgi:predicted GNAT family N-acyltransferase